MANITFTDPNTKKTRNIVIDIPSGKENDQGFLEKTIDDYIANHPTGLERSSKRGSLKTGPPVGPGIISGIANTLGYPIQSMMNRVAAHGAPEETDPKTGQDTRPLYRQVIGGLNDTAANAFDEAALPTMIRGGIEGLWPAAKGIAGYAAGSKLAETGADLAGAPAEVSQGLGMLAGAGMGGIAAGGSPKITAKVKAGVEAAKDTPISRHTATGVLGYGLGTALGHELHAPTPWATTGPAGAAIATKAIPFARGIMEPNNAPMIHPALIPEARPAEGAAVGMGTPSNAAALGPEHAMPAWEQMQGYRTVQKALPQAPERVFNMGDPQTTHYPPGTGPEPSVPISYPPKGLPAGVGNRSGQAISLAPTERVPGTGKFGPAGTKATREVFYGTEAPSSVPEQVPASQQVVDVPAVAAEQAVQPAVPTTQPIQQSTNEIKPNVQPIPSQTPQEAQPTSVQASQLGPEPQKTQEATPALPNSKNINPVMDQILSIVKPEWGGEQISYPHMKEIADHLGIKPNQVGRMLIELGYDVVPSKLGGTKYGLDRPGKKDNDIPWDRLIEALKGLPKD